jgi:hypothetical protein
MTSVAPQNKWMIRNSGLADRGNAVHEERLYWTGMAWDRDFKLAQLFESQREVDAHITSLFPQEPCPPHSTEL